MSSKAKTCVICTKGNADLNENPSKEKLEKLHEYARKRCSFGETKFATVCERIENLSDGFFDSAFHWKCYKDIVHSQKLERAEKRFRDGQSTVSVAPPKRGRPSSCLSSTQGDVPELRPSRSNSTGRIKRCIFECKDPKSGEIHRVMSENMGMRFMYVKKNSPLESVRVKLAFIEKPLDCVAYDVHYHRNCIRMHERKCESVQGVAYNEHDRQKQFICDVDMIHALQCTLAKGEIITVSYAANIYRELLEQNGLSFGISDKRKYLKELITRNIEGVDFVKSHRMNESEHIVCKQLLGKAISNLRETQEDEDEEIDIEILSKAARMLRKEILSQEKWNFSGSFDDFKIPEKLECFMKWLLVGPKEVEAVSKRDISAKKAVEKVCQIAISSVITDRQRTYNTKQIVG
eukprot:gene13489-14886_t